MLDDMMMVGKQYTDTSALVCKEQPSIDVSKVN